MDVVCLYEESGYSARAWAEAGHDVHCYDILNEERIERVGDGWILWHNWDARDQRQANSLVRRHKGETVLLLAYPPCNDLAVSGAAWFKKKEAENPNYLEEAMALVFRSREIANKLDVPYCVENPVSRISSQWRKPDFKFDPTEFGGYLPEDDVHPDYPEYIAPRDAYYKKTCYWVGNGFVLPTKKPVPPEPKVGGRSRQDRMLGGKSAKTKRIRSMSPRGVNYAIYEANNYRSLL